MYNATFWSHVIGSLAWPVVVFVIIFIFRNQIKILLLHIKSASFLGFNFEFNDTVDVYSPVDKTMHTIKLEEPSSPIKPEEAPSGKKVEIQKLDANEIEASRKRAQERLDEDTKRVGYKRGELFQLPNGGWAIAWKAEATFRVGIK